MSTTYVLENEQGATSETSREQIIKILLNIKSKSNLNCILNDWSITLEKRVPIFDHKLGKNRSSMGTMTIKV